MQTVRVPLGRSRAFDFRITRDGKDVDISTMPECRVVVVARDGSSKYEADCAPKAGDPTSRVVILRGTASDATGNFKACIHFTETGGEPDAESFLVTVYQHA